ncbi:uncharacterized protein LOC123563489 isoform X2 [Mercenaria mercenaria]|nr:uncharacterized protein LOC123563489 isoform X2 [Mercenaria mercenaria]XP_045212255.2 uncharacterized protein LOC123563489 isoform X2 [Mercenaria mercenaria]XP_045212256.2 uncharacterized protein LOC123563489 isoform X2 [Mercenaria mercenaria]
MMWYQFLAVLPLCWLPGISGHGRLIDPPSRSSMWRYGFKNPPNYDDNQLYCGGVQVQYELNGGKCGVCGDPWNGPRPNEPPGKYANGIIVRKYSPGEVITVVIELTANHKGWMEFKICPNDDPLKTVTQECLDRYVLPLAETRSRKYHVPNKNGYQKLRIKLKLPQNVKCKACLFQWMYNAGNSWGTDKVTGRGCVGCGNQEQFYGCADIAIGYDDIRISSHKRLPADEDEDPNEDYDNVPEINEWHWTAKPSITPEWETSTDKQIQTIHKDSQSFSFMPVMNNNGMNPCMCVCKRAPLKMNGGKKDSIEVKFFDGLEGQDNQVCMCMCQNSASNYSFSFLFILCAVIITRALKMAH